MNAHRTLDRTNLALLLVAFLAGVLLVAGVAPHGSDAPDVTVATCDAFTQSGHPPVNTTYQDRCVDTDGTIVYTPDANRTVGP